MSGKLVLVTGITGFIAGHVANAYLAAGYRVRGTTRGAKAKQLTETIKVEGLEFIQVDDIAKDDLTKALEGVYAIIHIAAPLPGRTSVEDTLHSAINGTTNILEAAVKAKIDKLVITSTFGALIEPSLMPAFGGLNITYKDWSVVTKEQLKEKEKEKDDFYIYFASKYVAEQAVWEFAEKHPQLDIATILPGFVYGPYAEHFPLPAEVNQLGTNSFIYKLIKGIRLPPVPPFVVDVRDTALAHIRAIDVPRKALKEKRYIVNAGNLSWPQAAAYLNKVRPDIKTVEETPSPDIYAHASTLDTQHTADDLNITEWIKPEDTVIAAVNALEKLEASWAEKGSA